jgi:DNA repair exonuclease SbcCD ATPase subunit
MRIQSIDLTNFRCFAGATIDLPTRVTFLVAKNHFGKSTVIDALQWALTGSCRGTSADGKGSDALIRDAEGVAQMKVGVGIDASEGPALDRLKPFRVERMQNARMSTFAIEGIVGTRHDTSAQLADRLGVSPAVLAACLDTEAFLELHHAHAKRVLMEILDVHVDVDGERITFDEVERRYDHWYQERPRRKKALDAIRLPDKPADGQVPDVAALEQKLATLREQEKAIIAATAQDSGRRQELERQLAHGRSEIARLTSKRLALLTVRGVDLDEAIVELEKRIAIGALTEAEQTDGEQARLSLVDAGGRLKLLNDTLHAVKTHAPERGCVLDADVECRTPAKEFKKAVSGLQAQLDELRTQQDVASKTLEGLRLRQADVDERQRRLAELQAQRRQCDAVTADLETMNDTVTRLQFEIDALAPATGPDPKLVQLRDRIQKGEAVIADVRSEASARQAYETTYKAQQVAAASLAEAERNVDLYGPKGARVKALESALTAFHGRINEALARFGYRLRIVPDPWMVLVNDRPAALLSKSERLQAGIAVQLAIAEVSGVGFVAIDQVDLFDADNRRAFGALLDATPVQVLAAMTRDDSFEPPDVEGWTWQRLVQVDGVTRVVPCGEAVLA